MWVFFRFDPGERALLQRGRLRKAEGQPTGVRELQDVQRDGHPQTRSGT